MPTYVILFSWTQKGIENVKESPSRLEAAKSAFQAAGGELREFYSTMGRYDGVVIGEFPSDEAVARVGLATGSAGAVRTETLRAFTEDEYRKTITDLP